MNLDALALAVDAHVQATSTPSGPARLLGVRIEGGALAVSTLATGAARRIPRQVRPPAGLAAIALSTTGWAAPMEADRTMPARPSRHPQRRRIHVTAIIAGADAHDVSVLRYEDDDDPTVLTGAVGAVHDALRRCWARRTEPAGTP